MFYDAIKLIIITEKLISRKVCEIIEEQGGKGYTMVPAGGRGLHHFHATDSRASVVDDFTELKIEVILSHRDRAEAIAEKIMTSLFQDYPGIIYLENVRVIRKERF
ncbi:P-II family nitrogen regulator [Salinispira pacifica]|uniref:Nitrogen regulatory protein P-II n=1 Tax=Salinispira pacifica TaxID=1307761 RepID=V5WHA0_9SPIO|nr:hypothetical protein [Salinispira pacifica]AHC14934.1 hypothetical protein L21SP2_1541 [Salinispira pacifica]